MNHDSNNIMVILSSPSGAGKTTISKKIQQKYQNFKISVSHTTRKPRPNEVEGIDYYFINENDFENKIKNNEFYEYAKIFGNYYGTSKESVLNLLKNKIDVLFDIDWQGAQKLSNYSKDDMVSVFILPPNNKSLLERLKKRNEDSIKTVKKRMGKAKSEISHWIEYDYIVINEDLEQSANEVITILRAERKKRSRQKFVFDLIEDLTK